MTKRLRVIAGPNGSGKTTLFRQLGKQISLYDFINADEIKAQLEEKGRFPLPFDVAPEELVNAIQASSFDNSVKQFFSTVQFCVPGKTSSSHMTP